MSATGRGEMTARVLFGVSNIRAGSAPIFPRAEVIVEYRQGGQTAGLLSLPLRGSALRAAVTDCARPEAAGAARPKHCDEPPDLVNRADYTAVFLEAFLPAQNFRDYQAVALPGWAARQAGQHGVEGRELLPGTRGRERGRSPGRQPAARCAVLRASRHRREHLARRAVRRRWRLCGAGEQRVLCAVVAARLDRAPGLPTAFRGHADDG